MIHEGSKFGVGISPFGILKIPAGSSPEEIKRAYRRLARRYHPDVNKSPGANEQMRIINTAYKMALSQSKPAVFQDGWFTPKVSGRRVVVKKGFFTLITYEERRNVRAV